MLRNFTSHYINVKQFVFEAEKRWKISIFQVAISFTIPLQEIPIDGPRFSATQFCSFFLLLCSSYFLYFRLFILGNTSSRLVPMTDESHELSEKIYLSSFFIVINLRAQKKKVFTSPFKINSYKHFTRVTASSESFLPGRKKSYNLSLSHNSILNNDKKKIW